MNTSTRRMFFFTVKSLAFAAGLSCLTTGYSFSNSAPVFPDPMLFPIRNLVLSCHDARQVQDGLGYVVQLDWVTSTNGKQFHEATVSEMGFSSNPSQPWLIETKPIGVYQVRLSDTGSESRHRVFSGDRFTLDVDLDSATTENEAQFNARFSAISGSGTHSGDLLCYALN